MAAQDKVEVITRVYAYHANGKFHRITVKISPRAIAREAVRKGLADSKTHKATRAGGAVIVEAQECSQVEAFRISRAEVV